MGNSSSSQHSPTTIANKSELIQAQPTLQSAPINIVTQIKQVSRKKSEEEKILQLNQIQNYIENLDGNQLITEIDIKLCIEMKKLIGVCKTSFQQEILNIILIIAEKGSEMVERLKDNQFYQIFEESGLMKRINEIFLQQIKMQQIKNKKYQYNDLFSKLVLIISYLNKYSEIDQNILEEFGKYFKFQINELVQILNMSINQQYMKEQQDEQIQQQIESEIRKVARMIQAISGIAEDQDNQEYFVEQLKIHEDIAPLIHLRCPQQLNCPQNLNLPESEYSNQLLNSVISYFNELFQWEPEVMQFLIINQNILQHLFQIIISFSTNHSHQVQNPNQILENSNSTQLTKEMSLVDKTMLHLCSILTEYTSFCQIAYNTPELLKVLINLTSFERKQHHSDKIDKSNAQIRIWSNNFLDRINCYGDKYVKEGIINEYKFIKIQTEVIGLGGGSEEQNEEVIESGLANLYNINYINRERDDEKYHGQTILLKTINEYLEEEGGLEEIENNQFLEKQFVNNFICNPARAIIRQINYIKKDPTNEVEDENDILN